MEVVEVLPTGRDPAVLKLEDDAAVNVQALTVSRPAVVMNPDHATFIICEHVLQFGLEGPFRLPAIPGELVKHLVAPSAYFGFGCT